MSRNRQRRRSIRWARYLNRYSHIQGVEVITWGAIHAMSVPGDYWGYVRRQAKRPIWGER